MIYFDAAATTLQKPPQVARASAWAIQCCASPGRGDHLSTRMAESVLFRCREEVSELFETKGPEQVVFCMNATHALNIAIRSLVTPGSRVAVSCWEHNAVTRTLDSIPGVEVMVVQAPVFDRQRTIAAFAAALAQKPDVVVCTWMSNVYGYILPIAEIDALCARAGVPLIIDASQAAGTVPISFRELSARYIAFPGHKGLYGPQGTGVLLCKDSSAEPLITGGTGGDSMRKEMPPELPERLEAGTHNVAGVAGLLEGVRFIKRVTPEVIARHERKLLQKTASELRKMKGVTVFYAGGEAQGGVLSLVVNGMDCNTLAYHLAKRGIAVRAGLHCAPLAHRNGGTLDSGTVRLSFSAFNTEGETERFIKEFHDIIHRKLT